MKFKLAIGDYLTVRVQGSVNDSASAKGVPFDFKLTMKRLPREKFLETVGGKDVPPVDFFLENTVGWSGQKLVLNDDDTPADYSPEAMEAMLSIATMDTVIYVAYMQENQASNTPKGRTGN